MGFSLKGIGRKITDIFDANSEEDQRKRVQAGQSRFYADQQRAQGNTRPAQNVAQQVVGNTLRLGNTAAAGVNAVNQFGSLARKSAFGTDEDYQNKLNEIAAQLKKDLGTKSGAFGAGTVFDSPEQAGNISAADLTKKIVGTGAGVVGEVGPLGGTGKAAKGASLARKIVKPVVVNATEAGLGSAGSQLALEGKVDAKRTLIDTGIGIGLGAGSDLLTPLASKAVKGAVKPVVKLKDTATSAVLDKLPKKVDAPAIPEPKAKDLSFNDTQQLNTVSRLQQLTEKNKALKPDTPEFKANKLEIDKSLRDLDELNVQASQQADLDFEANRPKPNPEEIEVRKAAEQARAQGNIEEARLLEESLAPEIKVTPEQVAPVEQAVPVKQPVGVDPEGRAYDANGEYIEAPKPPVVDRTIPRTERLKSAATPEDLEAFRGDVKSEVSEAFEGVDKLEVQKEVAAYSRGDITADQLSPETKVTMEKIKAITDDLTPEELRTKELYLPEMSSKYAPVASDGTAFSEFDKSFSTSKKRNNLLDPDEMLDPEEAMHIAIDQRIYKEKADLIESARYKTYKAPEKYVANKRAVVDDLAKSMDKEVAKKSGKSVVRLQKETSKNVGERLHQNFKETGDPSEMLGTVQDPMPTASLFRTNREALKGVEISPQVGTLYDITIARHERAQGMANELFTRAKQSGDFSGTVKAQYDELYENGLAPTKNSGGVAPMKDIMPKEQYDFIVDNHARQAESTGSPVSLASLERKLNAETAIYYRERLDFADPRVDKAFNDELSYLIKDGNRVRSLAEKAVNEAASMIHVGLLGLKPRSAALNLTELARVYADTTGKDGLKTLVTSLKNARPKTVQKKLAQYGISDDLISDATEDLIKVKRSEGNVALKGYRKVQQGVMLPFQTTENFKDFTLLTALEQKYKNIADPAQKRIAILDDFNRAAYKYGHGGSVRAVQKSKLARLAGQFGQYTMKDLGYMGERMGKGDYGFVAKTLGMKASVAVPMYIAFGATVLQTLGLSDYKGGPLVSLINEAYTQMGYEDKRIEEEGGEFNWDNVKNEVMKKSAGMVVPAGDMLINKLGVHELSDKTKDLPFLRDDNTISDNRRGYNAGKDGRARFAVGGEQESVLDEITRWVNGTYNGSEAREYFGNSPFDVEFYGAELYKPNKDNRQVPIDSRWQDKVEAASTAGNGGEIRRLIDNSREYQGLKKTAFKDDPKTEQDYKAIMKADYNKETGKRENDVLKPEKWARVNANPKLFDLLKARTLAQQQEFGGEIDPIFGLTDPDQIKRVMTIRAQNTGDNVEEEEILRATTDWYDPFEKKEVAYGASFGDSEMNEDFGNSARKQAWIDSYVEQPEQVKQYYQLKKTNPDAAKALFDTTNLSDVFDQYKSDRLKSINIKRELEGVEPIAEDVFGNVTFGYEHDEDKVATELYFKGKGKGYGSRGSGSGGGGGRDSVGSLHKYDVKLKAGDGFAKAKVSVRKGSKITAKKTSKPKVALKRSKV